MQLFLNILASSILQIVILSLLPFIWWLVTARKKEGFFKWIGLKGCSFGKLIGPAALVLVLFLAASAVPMYMLRGTEMATSQFEGLGAAGIPAALVYAILQTGLSEEIFFRGFLLKRIANKFGFAAGNTVQAVLFGLLHGAGLFSQIGTVMAIIVTLLTGGAAFAFGWLNEKKAGGSILPSWCVHAVSNIIASFAALFSLMSLI